MSAARAVLCRLASACGVKRALSRTHQMSLAADAASSTRMVAFRTVPPDGMFSTVFAKRPSQTARATRTRQGSQTWPQADANPARVAALPVKWTTSRETLSQRRNAQHVSLARCWSMARAKIDVRPADSFHLRMASAAFVRISLFPPCDLHNSPCWAFSMRLVVFGVFWRCHDLLQVPQRSTC